MISNNLKKIMKEKGISAKYLADKVGMSATHLSYVLNEKRNLSLELAGKIATVLDVNMSQLFRENEDLYADFSPTIQEFFTPLQKSVFELITDFADKHGEEFLTMLAEASEFSRNRLTESIRSLKHFALLPIEIQTRLFSNILGVSKVFTKNCPPNDHANKQKKSKDILKLLEQEQELTLNDEILSPEDLEVIKSAVEQGYYLAKRLNKRRQY